MKKILLLFVSIFLTLNLPLAAQPTIWAGPTITFSKADYADWTLPENQDSITNDVWITRKNNQGIFNIFSESGFSWDNDSPENTEWAYGTLAGYDTLTYLPWVEWANWEPPCTVGKQAVLHLISDDIYMEIMFTSWTEANQGGGFSYERSTLQSESVTTLTPVASVDGYSATSGGNVIDDGGLGVGVCWNTTGSPTIADNHTVDGAGPGVFSSSLTGLDGSTTYYVRAYASSSSGTNYGSEKSFTTPAHATVWNGPTTTFTKADYADWTLPENQDRITNDVWITRKNNQGIFNIFIESGFGDSYSDCIGVLSPQNTEWAYGTTANYASLDYKPWGMWNDWVPPTMVGQDAVLHLISENIFIDIKFTSWTQGGNGGGFSYERSTAPAQAVPVSNWAIVLGIFFIVVFMFFRYRRKIA